jgi:hypothetical protein
MSVNCPDDGSFTTTQLNAVYPQGILTNFPDSDRNSKGVLKPEVVKRKVEQLNLPILIKNNEDAYIAALDKHLTDSKAEYCFYYSRYSFALHKLIGAMTDSYANNSSDTQATINTYKGFAKTLNRKVNDLTLIFNGVSKHMLNKSDDLAKEITEFNEKISNQRDRLEKQNQIIISNESSTKIKQQMVKYTEEKARHTDKLLQLYSFMNIIAVGLLIYVYKAAN